MLEPRSARVPYDKAPYLSEGRRDFNISLIVELNLVMMDLCCMNLKKISNICLKQRLQDNISLKNI